MANLIKTYYQLTKPGIIYGNAITTIAGFFLASKGHIHFGLFVATLLGISLVIASACVFNNYIDRDIDDKMERTKNRALVKKLVPIRNAILFATILGLVGIIILILYTNLLTVGVALVGMFFYLVLYSISKRRSIYGTIVGSISGAMPIVGGYTAVSNRFDSGAFILFLILVAWQMPHFYAIALYRLGDYTNASIPVLPVRKGIFVTKIHIVLYILAFLVASLSLSIFGLTGYIYFVVAALLGLLWLIFGIQGFMVKDTRPWARKMFVFSLITIIVLCIAMSLNAKA